MIRPPANFEKLHPALRSLAQHVIDAKVQPIAKLSLEEARALSASAVQLSGPGDPMSDLADVDIPVRHGTIAGRLLIPNGPVQAFVVYFHGGGWVLGSIESYDPVARMVATELRCAVLLVEYRLAPQFPFPAGLQDCLDALVWASQASTKLTGSPLPLVVMGDSAGGNLAAVSALHARTEGPVIEAQILIVPATDATPTTASYHEVWHSPLFGGRSMEWFWSKYQPDPSLRLIPEISPARSDSLANLPPTIVITTEHDPLRDEGRAYVDAMRVAGNRVVHRHYEDLSHGFLNLAGLFNEPRRVMAQVGVDLAGLLTTHQ